MTYPDRDSKLGAKPTMSVPPSPPSPAEPTEPTEPKKPSRHDGLAIASLVLGIVWIWGLGSLLAVIFGGVHMVQAGREGRNSSGMAIAGLILGIIGLVGAVALTVLLIVAASSQPTPYVGG
jgi:hypothetical protein